MKINQLSCLQQVIWGRGLSSHRDRIQCDVPITTHPTSGAFFAIHHLTRPDAQLRETLTPVFFAHLNLIQYIILIYDMIRYDTTYDMIYDRM